MKEVWPRVSHAGLALKAETSHPNGKARGRVCSYKRRTGDNLSNPSDEPSRDDSDMVQKFHLRLNVKLPYKVQVAFDDVSVFRARTTCQPLGNVTNHGMPAALGGS